MRARALCLCLVMMGLSVKAWGAVCETPLNSASQSNEALEAVESQDQCLQPMAYGNKCRAPQALDDWSLPPTSHDRGWNQPQAARSATEIGPLLRQQIHDMLGWPIGMAP